jgi:hypothetical protein
MDYNMKFFNFRFFLFFIFIFLFLGLVGCDFSFESDDNNNNNNNNLDSLVSDDVELDYSQGVNKVPLYGNNVCLDGDQERLGDVLPIDEPKDWMIRSKEVINNQSIYVVETDNGERIHLVVTDFCGELSASRYVSNDLPITLSHEDYEWVTYRTNDFDSLHLYGNTLVFSEGRYVFEIKPYPNKNTDIILKRINYIK